MGQICVAVAENNHHAELGRTKFLITTKSQLSNRQLVMRYRHRWVIELFFRDCKQHFGFAGCQGRESYQMMFHYRMVFLDSSLIDLVTDCVSVSTLLTVGLVIANLRILWVLRIEGSEPQPVEIHLGGRIKAVGWKTFLNAVRTCLPIEIEEEIPDSIYDLNIAE